MKTIKFSNEEVSFLIGQYQDELEQAKEYVDQIVEILNKLGANAKPKKEEPAEKEPRQYKKRGSKPKAGAAEPKGAPKKRGRKPKIAAVATPETTPAPKQDKKKAEPKKKKAAAKAAPAEAPKE